MFVGLNRLNSLVQAFHLVIKQNTLIFDLSSQMVNNSVFNIFHLLVYFIYEVIQIIRVNNVLLFVFKCAETSLELVNVLLGETTQSMLRTSNLRDHRFEFLNSLLVRASAI